MSQLPSETLHHLALPEGRITYTDSGHGPLVVLVPGMGDVRATYALLVPVLVEAGYRVVVTDLRGHGDSDTGFRSYGDAVTASDLVALVEHLAAGPAVLVGSSMGGSAAVIAAADRPDLVNGVVTLAGFYREAASPAVAALLRLVYRAVFAWPWGGAFWTWYVRSALSKGRPTPGLDERLATLRATYRDRARLRSLRRLAVALDHRQAERRLSDVHTPVLAVFGSADPDFSDAAAELAYARETVDADGVVLEEVGHYPQLQAADEVLAVLLPFLASTTSGTDA
ncbi:alpha/beta hydrolase [Mumia sp. zg.B21]|uniref:alpha/beta fold hydrolase n=1 Tax=Mumia sp. zg.B21 TaxID=2855447 RepID=UPI001C6E8F33|nr:alpha/beta hydrolase [Mumia sp. zg.B21]MBW9209967.1 alpha/beta hydrolase [Mumia sp. zg.B21]